MQSTGQFLSAKSLTQLSPLAPAETTHHERRKKVSRGLTNTCRAAEKTAMDAMVFLSQKRWGKCQRIVVVKRSSSLSLIFPHEVVGCFWQHKIPWLGIIVFPFRKLPLIPRLPRWQKSSHVVPAISHFTRKGEESCLTATLLYLLCVIMAMAVCVSSPINGFLKFFQPSMGPQCSSPGGPWRKWRKWPTRSPRRHQLFFELLKIYWSMPTPIRQKSNLPPCWRKFTINLFGEYWVYIDLLNVI